MLKKLKIDIVFIILIYIQSFCLLYYHKSLNPFIEFKGPEAVLNGAFLFILASYLLVRKIFYKINISENKLEFFFCLVIFAISEPISRAIYSFLF